MSVKGITMPQAYCKERRSQLPNVSTFAVAVVFLSFCIVCNSEYTNMVRDELAKGNGQDSNFYSDKNGNAFQLRSPFSEISYANSGESYAVYKDFDQDHDLPIILWWTDALFPHFTGPERDLAVVQCRDVQCYSTRERRFLKDKRTRALYFYGTDIDPQMLPLPRRRNHEWALFHEESPLNNYILCHKAFIELFNHTCTFRRESDYPITTQNIYNLNFLTEKQPMPLHVKNTEKKKKNLAAVLYVQSHCDVPSDRDRYVAELMKHIRVDSYGKCLHNRDLPEHLQNPEDNFEKDEFLEFISLYKFHLAFENAVCKDYMTEKLMRPLNIGVVPIYKGSVYAKDWMPGNKSIILVDDFESPRQLAEFINYLDENDDEYLKYVSYKTEGITNQFLLDHLKKREWSVNEDGKIDYFRGFECHVCRKLNERIQADRAHKVDSSVPLLPPKMANNSHLGCPQPYPAVGDPDDIPQGDIWHKSDWIRQYWDEFDKARGARNMLLAGETDPSKFLNYYREVVANQS